MMNLSEGNSYWTPEVLAQALLGIWSEGSYVAYRHRRGR